MNILSAANRIVDQISYVIGSSGIGSGIGSATAGFDPQLNRYAPLEYSLRPYSLMFIFLPSIFKYLFSTYSSLNLEILATFEKYQHVFVSAVDSGVINIDVDEVGSDRPLVRYRYPNKMVPPSQINTTLIDAYQVFRCLLGSDYSCVSDDFAGALTTFGQITNNLSRATNLTQRFAESLGLLDKGIRRSILRPILEAWFDYFDQLIFDEKGIGTSYKRQRNLTNPNNRPTQINADDLASTLSREDLAELLIVKRLQQTGKLSSLLAENPGLAYKGAILLCRITPDRKPQVTSAYMFVGAFPTQLNLIDFNWRDNDFDYLMVAWTFDMILTGPHIINFAQTLVTEMYENFKPADQLVLDIAGNVTKTLLENAPKISDFVRANNIFNQETVNICDVDVGTNTDVLREALALQEGVEGLIRNLKSPRGFKQALNTLQTLSGNAARTLRGLRTLF